MLGVMLFRYAPGGGVSRCGVKPCPALFVQWPIGKLSLRANSGIKLTTGARPQSGAGFC